MGPAGKPQRSENPGGCAPRVAGTRCCPPLPFQRRNGGIPYRCIKVFKIEPEGSNNEIDGGTGGDPLGFLSGPGFSRVSLEPGFPCTGRCFSLSPPLRAGGRCGAPREPSPRGRGRGAGSSAGADGLPPSNPALKPRPSFIRGVARLRALGAACFFLTAVRRFRRGVSGAGSTRRA